MRACLRVCMRVSVCVFVCIFRGLTVVVVVRKHTNLFVVRLEG